MAIVYVHLLLPTCEMLIFPQHLDFKVCKLDHTSASLLTTVAGGRGLFRFHSSTTAGEFSNPDAYFSR
jgi:hypothetical protein